MPEEEGLINDGTTDTSSSTGLQEGVVQRIWSVRFVISLVCFVGIASSGIMAETLSEVSCDSSLADTREVMRDATSELSASSTRALRDVTRDLLGRTLEPINGIITIFFHSTLVEVETVMSTATSLWIPYPRNSRAYFESLARPLWEQIHVLNKTEPTAGASIFAGGKGISVIPSFEERSMEYLMTRRVIVRFFDGVNSTQGNCMPGSGLPITPVAASGDLPAFTSLFALLPANEVRFSHLLHLGAGQMGYVLMGKVPDPTKSVAEVNVVLYVAIGAVQFLLGEFGQQPGAIHKTQRVYATIASSWVADTLKNMSHPLWKDYEQTNVITACSHGTAFVSQGPGVEPLLRKDTESDDALIASMSTNIADIGGYSKVLNTATFIEAMHNGTNEEFCVASLRNAFHRIGLDWYLTVFIDTTSIFQGVWQSEAEVAAKIALRQETVESDISKDRNVVKAIVGAVGFALILVSVVISYFILRPILAMQQNMSLVANMELDSIAQSNHSTLCELRRMQYDFGRMVENLLEFRAYVPLSVLEGKGAEFGGRKTIEPPTGNVAIVFTDIKGSTALWKRSAGDMNDAMEIHNEVMRDCCAEFNGYEVKTIGDSFMVSFSDEFDAAKFTLAVQEKFAKKKWPKGLGLPKSGLVIRIGVHYGPTIAEENPVTGRVDYRGSTVNLASRVEAKAKGGTICITSDMFAAIKGKAEALGMVAMSHGSHDIRGLGNGHELFLMVPRKLRMRFNDAQSDCNQHRGDHSQPLQPITPRTVVSGETASTALSKHGGESGGKVQRRTDLSMIKAQATVAVCRLGTTSTTDKLFDNCNIMVRAAIEAASSTDGVIGNVTGRTLTVVWNASKKCTMHSTAALNFVSEMKKLQGIMQVGLATGTMLHGNVGTKTSRFATSFGLPGEAAEAMTDYASTFGVYCLYADCTVDKRLQADATVRSTLRMVDAWKDSASAQHITIYEVHLPCLSRAIQGWEENGWAAAPSKDKTTDVDHHTRLVTQAIAGHEGLSRLREYANEMDDPVLKKVVTTIEGSTPHQGYRCKITFSKVPGEASAALSSSIVHPNTSSVVPVHGTALQAF